MPSSSIRVLLRLCALDSQLYALELAETRARRQWGVLSQRRDFLAGLIEEERRHLAETPECSARARLAAMEAELSAFTDALARLDREVEGGAGARERERLGAERLAAVRDLPAGLAAEYDTLVRAGRHPALVAIEGGFCAGCHLRVPAQLESQARRSHEVVRCPHCRRLLLDRALEERVDG